LKVLQEYDSGNKALDFCPIYTKYVYSMINNSCDISGQMH